MTAAVEMGQMNNKKGGADGKVGSDEEVELTPGEILQNRLWACCVCCALFVVLPLVLWAALNPSVVRHIAEPSASCANCTCPSTMLLRPDANAIFCVEAVCTAATDARNCCVFKAGCPTLACPAGYFPKLRYSSIRCQGVACSLETDLDTCCEPAGTCPDGLTDTCPHYFAVAPDAVGRQCQHVWCEEQECCSATCAEVGCGRGQLTDYLPAASGEERFCNDPRRCISDEFATNSDVEHCCAASCGSTFFGDCPDNFEPLDYDEGLAIPCANFDCSDPSDPQTCCKENAKCASLSCPEGTSPVAGAADQYCLGAVCTEEDDAFDCCAEPLGQLEMATT